MADVNFCLHNGLPPPHAVVDLMLTGAGLRKLRTSLHLIGNADPLPSDYELIDPELGNPGPLPLAASLPSTAPLAAMHACTSWGHVYTAVQAFLSHSQTAYNDGPDSMHGICQIWTIAFDVFQICMHSNTLRGLGWPKYRSVTRNVRTFTQDNCSVWTHHYALIVISRSDRGKFKETNKTGRIFPNFLKFWWYSYN